MSDDDQMWVPTRGGLLTWLRDLGARWAAPRPDPPELAAVEAQIGPDPRAALAVDRALGAVGTCTYSLGKGGRHPESPTPGDAQGRLDCSGFASWCLGLDRKSDAIDGGWISTDSIVRDATGKRRLFRVVPAGQIRAGDLVVFPGRYVAGRRVAIGHVGVVVEAGPTIEASRVAHCHGPSGRSPAISVRDGRTWRRGIAVRLVAWG